MISVSAVEGTLLQLAADREIGVQAVAARALARWRDGDEAHNEDLFETLHRWQHETNIINIVKTLIRGDDEETRAEPEDYIRATVMLTVGYAALYDPPNQLSESLYDLLKQLSEDRNQLVRHRFRNHTLLIVVPQHLRQLKTLLYTLVEDVTLHHAIGMSLARAYHSSPEDVMTLLNDWYDDCQQHRRRGAPVAEPTHREKLLSTIALTVSVHRGFVRFA